MRTRRGRRWRSTWQSAAVSVFAVLASAMLAGSASPRPQAHASADTLLQTINVPLNGSKVYSAPLVAGGVYRIVASGTYTQTGGSNPEPVVRDALYCFSFYAPPVGCSPPDPVRRQYLTIVRYEGDASLQHDLDNLDPATTLPYNPQHTYQETFTAPSATRLETFCNCNQSYSYQGGIRLDLYVVSLPTAPAPPPGTRTTPRVLDPASAWGQAGPATALAPGGAVVAPSPVISRKQREVEMVVAYVDAMRRADIAFAVATAPDDCILEFIGALKNKSYGPPAGTVKREIVRVQERGDLNILYILALFACLEEVKAADDARAGRVTAARSGCALRANQVDVDYDRGSRTAHVRARRSRRGTSRASRTTPGLIVSCREARNGAVAMRVRTDSRRLRLRRLVGKRILFGVYRAREASGTAKVRMRFNRR